jgi:branched-chain amino acid transport system substrate-binding protein
VEAIMIWSLRNPFGLAVAGGALAAALLANVAPARAEDGGGTLKLGIVAFLSGPAAGPFGVPARNAAELMIDHINAGDLPAPYNSKGLAGLTIEPVYIDEAGGTTTQVTELRNLVQREHVDAVIGYISSGSCLAVAPVAEELKVLTVLFDCGTPRIFEEASYKYVFRTAPHATMDSVGAARYVQHKLGGLSSYAGINQNYAWGQDSWRDFVLAMKTIEPKATVSKELFPKLFAGEYGSEISALLVSNAQVLHSSLWGGDLESFIFQSVARGLPQRLPMVLTTAETAMFRLGSKLPDGVIIGARGPNGVLAKDTELNRWLQSSFTGRYGTPPIYSAYHMAQALLGLKSAYDKAAKAKGGTPTTADVIKAFQNLSFESMDGTVDMKLGNGHQAVSPTAYGTYKFDQATNTPTIVDVVRYPADCVNPPKGMHSVDWLKAGMPGAKCG